MKQGIRLNIGVKVVFVISEDLDIGSKESRSSQGFGHDFKRSLHKFFAPYDKNRQHYNNQGRIYSSNSTGVEILISELSLLCLVNDDRRDEESRNDKEDINSNESTWHEFRKSVKDNHNSDSDGSKTVDVGTIGCST
jgi:hypothetical protein